MMIDSANGAVLNDILNLIEDRKIDDDWMPALVELLISFFTDDSQKTRSLVLSCFKQINQGLFHFRRPNISCRDAVEIKSFLS